MSETSNYAVREIIVTDIKSIREIRVPVGPFGVLLVGDNGEGKTAVLDAVRLAFTTGGAVDRDMIRNGADAAEVLVRLDGCDVGRTVPRDGAPKSTVTFPDFGKRGRPGEFIASLVGAGQLDAAAVALEKDHAKRKALVLAALPTVAITADELRAVVPGLPESIDVAGHALDVIGRLRSEYEAKRADVGREGKRLAAEAERLAAAVPTEHGTEDATADAALADAHRVRGLLAGQAAEAERAAARTVGQRERIAALRAGAATRREAGAELDACEIAAHRASETLADAGRAVELLRAKLADAEAKRDESAASCRDADARARACRDAMVDADRAEYDAQSLESALDAASVAAPRLDEIANVERAVAVASARAAGHAAHVYHAAALAKSTDARKAADAARATWHAHDATYKALGSDATAAVLAKGAAIPGLTFPGDGIALDGVSIDQLNEAERFKFCVRLAKMTSPRVRVLVTDGLERIAPAKRDAFIAECISGGWQLIGALVADGELRTVAIVEGTK